MAEPILVDCEGTCCPPASTTLTPNVGICAMCGNGVTVVDGVVVVHKRDDIIARLTRGDFG